jgi:hypothetical protein
MPITRISFGLDHHDSPTPGGEDVHVLRNQSTGDLTDRLWVLDAVDGHWHHLPVYRNANANQPTVEFRPVMRVQDGGARWDGFGIHVRKATGEVAIDDVAPPPNRPANFILEAIVTSNPHGVDPARIAPALLRVHVHTSVDHIRLTPRTLTIRNLPGTNRRHTRYAFAIRAWFDDGTSGDVTFSHEIETWTHPRFFWLDTAGDTHRISRPPNLAIPSGFDVTVTTSAAWGSRQAAGRIEFVAAWPDTPNLPQAEWIDGNPDILAGTRLPETVPNILLLSSGDPDPANGAFARTTDRIVHHAGHDPLLQPYGYLARSMNYWRLALPGQPGGVCVRGEVSPFQRYGRMFAKLVPSPEVPPASGASTLEHLLYMAGLPTPADVRLAREKSTNRVLATVEDVRALDADDIDFTRLTQKWTAMVRASPPLNVDNEVRRKWLLLANRTFVDEVDSFPAVAVGLPPSASFDDLGPLAFHDLRGGIDECRTFLANVGAAPRGGRPAIVLGNSAVDDDGAPSTAIGNLWGTELANAGTFDNRRFLALLCDSPVGRARWTESVGLLFRPFLSARTLAPDHVDASLPGLLVAPNATGDGLALMAPDPAFAARADTWRVFAHELAHAFGLGDEYVERAEAYSDGEDELDDYANLTTIGAILGAGGVLVPSAIKWNWHRILFATIVTGDITRAGGGGPFIVPVQPVPNFRIAQQNIVFLRERDPQVVINRSSAIVGPLQVVAVSPGSDRVTLVALAGNPDDVPASNNNVLFMPVPGPNSGQFYTLVSPAAARIMQIAIKGTMTGKECKIPDQMANDGDFTQVPVASDPVGRVSSKELPSLVGAYFGGRQYACGIVHPTGHCMMRHSHDKHARFCTVCRYVLVEQIDPVQHARVDSVYAKHYPL